MSNKKSDVDIWLTTRKLLDFSGERHLDNVVKTDSTHHRTIGDFIGRVVTKTSHENFELW